MCIYSLLKYCQYTKSTRGFLEAFPMKMGRSSASPNCFLLRRRERSCSTFQFKEWFKLKGVQARFHLLALQPAGKSETILNLEVIKQKGEKSIHVLSGCSQARGRYFERDPVFIPDSTAAGGKGACLTSMEPLPQQDKGVQLHAPAHSTVPSI